MADNQFNLNEKLKNTKPPVFPRRHKESRMMKKASKIINKDTSYGWMSKWFKFRVTYEDIRCY